MLLPSTSPDCLVRFDRLQLVTAFDCSNDLEYFSVEDVQQMASAQYDAIKVVALVDRGIKDPCVQR